MRRHPGFSLRLALGALGGIIFAAIWSGSFVATKIGLSDVSPLWLAGLRLAGAGILLMVLTLPGVMRLWRGLDAAGKRAIVISGLLSQGFYLGATYWSLVELPTGVVNVIVASLPLVSAPMAFLILREEVNALDIGTAGLGMFGIILVVLGRGGGGMTLTAFLTPAVMLTVAAVLALAAGNAMIKPYVSGNATLPTLAVQMLSSSIAVGVLAALQGGTADFALTARSGAALLYLVLIGSIAGTFIWYRVLHIFTVKAASVFFLFTPVFGLAIGWSFLDEPLTPLKVAGAGIVCGSIFLRSGSALPKLTARRQKA